MQACPEINSRYFGEKVMSNTKVLLGPISARLIENYDPLAASAILDLRGHEFLWEETKGTWHKFKLGASTSQ